MFYLISFMYSGRNADQRKIVQGELQLTDFRIWVCIIKIVMFSKVKLTFLPINEIC